jgi:hypothetical protein
VVTEWQFVAIAAFLLWCLVSSVCGALHPPDDSPARLIWREHDADGWSPWRPAYFGLTAADHRILQAPEPPIDAPARAALFETVLCQARKPRSDGVQFAIVRVASDPDTRLTAVAFVSDVRPIVHASRRAPNHAAAPMAPADDPPTEAHATYPSGRINSAAGAGTEPSTGSRHCPVGQYADT